MNKNAWFYLLLLSFIWGASFAFIEIALTKAQPFTLVCLRVCCGAAALWLWLTYLGQKLPISRAFWVPIFMMGFINNAVPFVLIAWGQQSISAGTASILNANTAFAGVLVSALFLAEERLKLRRLAGVLIGISGVILVIGPKNLLDISPSYLGQIAVLGATISYAFASVWGRIKLAQFGSTQLACGMLIAASVQMLVITPFIEGVPHAADIFTWQIFISMLGLGVVGTAIAYILYFKILQLAGASNVLLVTIIVPVFAVFLDAVLLSQFVGWQAVAGFCVVALGLAIMDGRIFGLAKEGH